MGVIRPRWLLQKIPRRRRMATRRAGVDVRTA